MDRIRFGHRVRSARWSSDEARWTVAVDRGGDGTTEISGNFLYLCSGYYEYEEGHAPHFEGQERFGGRILHPQFWPASLNYSGERVVIIGSGATAMTLAPAMAENGASVTMVQRSPTYVISRPDVDALANRLRKWLPERLAYAITRWKNITLQGLFYRQTRVRPEKVKNQLLGLVRRHLGPDYDLATHFTPRYNPWDQRLCLIPNADLFRAIKSGALEVVTDQIERFTERGIKLASGRELDADIIVTATGLKLAVMGGVTFTVDGKRVNFPDTTIYKGMMFSDVPNLVQTFGYINASWTLRADLTARYACRLLNRMAAVGARQCTPRLGDEDREMPRRPWIDDFSSGYMQRSIHLFPQQGNRDPWRHTQDYATDKKLTREPIEDGVLVLDNAGDAEQVRQRVA